MRKQFCCSPTTPTPAYPRVYVTYKFSSKFRGRSAGFMTSQPVAITTCLRNFTCATFRDKTLTASPYPIVCRNDKQLQSTKGRVCLQHASFARVPEAAAWRVLDATTGTGSNLTCCTACSAELKRLTALLCSTDHTRRRTTAHPRCGSLGVISAGHHAFLFGARRHALTGRGTASDRSAATSLPNATHSPIPNG